MQEAIKKVVDAEQQAAGIIAEAGRTSAEIMSTSNKIISEKLNAFRAEELVRFNKAVEDAENQSRILIDSIKAEDTELPAGLEAAIADLVLKRVLKTVFD